MVKELKMARGLKRRKLKAGAAANVGPRGTGEARSHSRLGTHVNPSFKQGLDMN